MSNVLIPSYVEIISTYYDDIQVSATDGLDYDTLILISGTSIPPKEDLDAYLITSIKYIIWKIIQDMRDKRKEGGVKVGNHWFHSDESSRIQQIGLVMFGANLPPGIMWKTMTGEFIEMTATLAQQIFVAVATSDVTVFGVAEYHRVNLNASTDPNNYNYMANWPIIYGE